MKKKKLTSKEPKRLLDEELAKRGVDPDARRHRQGSTVSKMAWLSPFPSEEEANETFVRMLIMSHELADEPEMEDLLFSPVQSVEVLTEVVQEMGLLTENGDLSDWKASEDTQMHVRQKVTEKLLTKQLQQQFEKAVTRLAERLKRAQDTDKFISVSAVRVFMETIKDPSAWATVGLVREVARRSLDAGFKILNFVDQQTSEEQSIGDVIRSLD